MLLVFQVVPLLMEDYFVLDISNNFLINWGYTYGYETNCNYPLSYTNHVSVTAGFYNDAHNYYAVQEVSLTRFNAWFYDYQIGHIWWMSIGY